MEGFRDERMLRVVGKANGEDYTPEVVGGGNKEEALTELERQQKIAGSEWLILRAIEKLEFAETITEIVALQNAAVGVHGFAKQQKDCFGLQQSAAALRIRAQHKAGAILATIARERGKRTDRKEGEQTEYQRVLEEERLDSSTANHWQHIAQIQDQVLSDFLAGCIVAEREITTAEVLRLLPEPGNGASSGSRSGEKPEMKSRRVLLVDTTELTIEEQDEIIWEAIGRAHVVSKKERMRAEMKALGQYPGYWLAFICAEYNAHNQLEGEQ